MQRFNFFGVGFAGDSVVDFASADCVFSVRLCWKIIGRSEIVMIVTLIGSSSILFSILATNAPTERCYILKVEYYSHYDQLPLQSIQFLSLHIMVFSIILTPPPLLPPRLLPLLPLPLILPPLCFSVNFINTTTTTTTTTNTTTTTTINTTTTTTNTTTTHHYHH